MVEFGEAKPLREGIFPDFPGKRRRPGIRDVESFHAVSGEAGHLQVALDRLSDKLVDPVLVFASISQS